MKNRNTVEVPITVLSCDFRAAATEFREKLVSTPEGRQALFEAIRNIDPTAGYVALETCNRTEWIVSTENPAWMSELLKAHMIGRWKETLPGLPVYPTPAAYLRTEAVRHVYRLVMGLESLATGEAQIAGQFQSAMARAREEHTLSPLLNRLGCGAGRLAKAGFRMGFRSNQRRGIHGLVCSELRNQFCDRHLPHRIAVVGMGDIGRRTAQMLEESGEFPVLRVNRTVRADHQAKWRPLEELPALSRSVDAIVVATGGLQPVVTRARLDLAGRVSVLHIIDIGVPRQVDDAVQGHPMVRYRNIDDLLDLPREEMDPETIRHAESQVEEEVERFLRFCLERDMTFLLDRIHRGRQEFSTTRIPAFVAANFGELDAKTRAKVEKAMKNNLADYAGEIRQALQLALEAYWSHR
jgi:glutamyl-tRNA reductase